MSNFAKLFALLLVAFAMCAPAFAEDPAAPAPGDQSTTEQKADTNGFQIFGCALGAGIIILGAGWGIGTIGSKAVEGTSRQPEAGGSIMTQMIISAALIEGATFFALIVCFMGLDK